MHGNGTEKQQRELTQSECDVVQTIDFYLQGLDLKKLAKCIGWSEEQVATDLRNLGLENVASKERQAELRKIHALAQEAWALLARAAQEGPPDR